MRLFIKFKTEVVKVLNQYSELFKASKMPVEENTAIANIKKLIDTQKNPIRFRNALEAYVNAKLPWYSFLPLDSLRLYKRLLKIVDNEQFRKSKLMEDWMDKQIEQENNQIPEQGNLQQPLPAEIQTLNDEIARLSNLLKAQEELNFKLVEENTRLKAQVDELTQEIERLKAQTKINDLPAGKSIPLADVNQINKPKEKPNPDVERLKAENSYLEKEKFSLAKQCQQYSKEVLDLKREIDKLKAMLEQQDNYSNDQQNKPRGPK